MDAFDFIEDPVEEQPKRKPGSLILRLGTLYFMLSALLLIAYFVVVFLNPYSSLNPFPPPTPSPSPESQSLLPTDTQEAGNPAAPAPSESQASPTDTQEAVQEPTHTTEPYPTPTDVILMTETPSGTEEAGLFFVAQEGTPSYLPYSGGCDGLYVAGNVIDIDNAPVMLMSVRAVGTLGETRIDLEALSGSNPDYTESGWEIKLLDALVISNGTISIALYRQGSREPVSEEVFIDTFNDCSKNLVVVNFVEERNE